MASYKYRDNGNVQITITHGKKFDGSPQRYYKDVPYINKSQLKKDTALFMADILNGNVAPSTSATVNALFNSFLQNYRPKKKSLSKATIARYTQIYKNQIEPYIGKRKLNTITRSDIRNWVSTLLEKGNSKTGAALQPKTVEMAVSLLSTIYTYAIFDLEIADKNPCTRIAVQPNDYKIGNDGNLEAVALNTATAADRYYSREEVKHLLSLLLTELKNPRSITHATLLHLVLFTGMRNGEVMGLKWSDIDFDSNTINIQRERLYVSTVGIVTDTPKTENSIRKISVPEFVMEMLTDLKAFQDNLKEKMGQEYQESGYVAVTVTGSPQHPRNLYKWFTYFQAKHELKKATIHDLRHTHAAMLSDMGTKIIDISKRLGHANTRITAEVYEYLFNNIDNQISNELNDYYTEIKKCSQNVVKEKTNA